MVVSFMIEQAKGYLIYDEPFLSVLLAI